MEQRKEGGWGERREGGAVRLGKKFEHGLVVKIVSLNTGLVVLLLLLFLFSLIRPHHQILFYFILF